MGVKTVTEQIYQEIREAILSQNIPAGEKLTIKMLHEKYGVSSSPIREALTRLQQDGLIEYKPNIGMSVITLTLDDLKEIFALITELDMIALKFAMSSDNFLDMIHELENVHTTAGNCISDNTRWCSLSDEFHSIFYKFAKSKRLTDMSQKLRMQLTIFSNQYEKEESNRISIHKEHDEVLGVIKKGNIKAAEESLHKHLKSSFNRALKAFSD